jgi:hypothetical protein
MMRDLTSACAVSPVGARHAVPYRTNFLYARRARLIDNAPNFAQEPR